MTLRVLAGLLIGLALALGLHPLSRPSLIEAFRAPAGPRELSAPFTALTLPSPDDPEAASSWMMAWLAERYRGSTVTEDQLLLLTEIAQAGSSSEPKNAYWMLMEGLLQHELGNKDASQRAFKKALAAPGFSGHSVKWEKAILVSLRDRDGSSRPVHLLSLSEAIKTWTRHALENSSLEAKLPEANRQLWIEGLARLEFPSSSSLDQAAIAQLPLALAQSLVFWGGASAFLAMVLMHPAFGAGRRSLSHSLSLAPLWLRKRLPFAPLALSSLLCVALGSPGRIIQGLPQTPSWLFWTLVGVVLLSVVLAAAAESDIDADAKPGWTASSCSALGLAGGVILLVASLWAHPFIHSLERSLGPH